MDYSELKEQISIAKGLYQYDYTADSWSVLSDALAKARSLTNSWRQSDVDAGASALKQAIAGLVKMDYSKLVAAIDSATELRDNDKLVGLWNSLNDALTRGAKMLESGDQQAVDALADEILDLIEQIKKEMGTSISTNSPVKEVEVEPSYPFCNISMHKVWPVLFWISFVLNLALIGLGVMYFMRRRKKQVDDTPLVDYDINDDFNS